MKKVIPRKSILYLDDDNEEVNRFRDVMRDYFIVGCGVRLDEALDELWKNRVDTPDLVLLDLYYGPETTPEMRRKILEADAKLSALEGEVRRLLNDAGQKPAFGFNLAEQVKAKFPRSARVFFSRKAFLEDALSAQKLSLPLMEKPDPTPAEAKEPDPYKAALTRHAGQLSRELDEIIDRNSFWVKHRDTIVGALVGLFVSFVWDVMKGAFDLYRSATVAFLAGGVIVVLAVWIARRLK